MGHCGIGQERQHPPGFRIIAPNNLIFGNTSRNPTNYVINPGNSFGPIINVAGVGDISGVPNADHSKANFSY